MRIVLDTNVFISGIFWEGNYCSRIINKWKNNEFDLISSKEIIEEFVNTMKNFKIRMPDEIIKEWEKLIIKNSIFVNPKIKIEIIKQYPDDNKFLEAGITGKANFIISQDKHLLNLKIYEEILIINPQNFLTI